VILGGNIEKTNRSSESLRASYRIDGVRDSITGEVPIRGTNMQVRYTEEIRKRYGASLTLDYKYDKGVIWISNFYSQTSRDIFSTTTLYSDATGNIRHRVRDREVDLRGLSSSINGEHRVLNMDIDWVLSRFHTQTDNWYDWQMEFHEDGGQPYDSTMVPGQPLTWPDAARNDLDYMYLRNAFMRPDTTKQTDYAAELNFSIPFTLGDKIGGYLKFGGKYIQTDRDRASSARGQSFYYLGGDRVSVPQSLYPEELILNENTGRIGVRNFITSPTDSKQIVNNEYTLFPLFDKQPVNKWYDTQQPDFHQDRYALANVYNLTETITAGYVMAKLNIGQVLTIIPGARYEYSDNIYSAVWSTASESYGSVGRQLDTTIVKAYGHWFPHLHMQFKPLSWFNLRASVNKTLARPNYDWISPSTQIVINNTSIRRGNPELVESTSWNYELAAAFHSNKFGLLSIGGFYKDISDIFYVKESRIVDSTEMAMLQIPGGGRGYTMSSFANSDKATVYGVEIDLQTQFRQFSSFPRFLQGIVLNVNYTRIWSETAFPFYSYKQVFDFSTFPATVSIDYEETERKGKMPGQSEHIFNFSLGYDIGGLSARASVMYQGQSIRTVGKIPEDDRWNDDFWRFDASLKYKLSRMVSFHANFANISSQPDRTFYGSTAYQTNRDYFGMTATLGVQFNL
jgi:TonB-dependent receptor